MEFMQFAKKKSRLKIFSFELHTENYDFSRQGSLT